MHKESDTEEDRVHHELNNEDDNTQMTDDAPPTRTLICKKIRKYHGNDIKIDEEYQDELSVRPFNEVF